jgi:alpha-amylase
MKPTICLYFHVHQPVRLNRFSIFSEKKESLRRVYFNESLNKHYFEKAAQKCYLPTNRLLLDLIKKFSGRFKLSYSITGTFLEQCAEYGGKVLDSFKALVDTGNVEILGETYYHSLASLYGSKKEFWKQVEAHEKLVQELFGQKPRVFRNTEVIYSNEIAAEVDAHGYEGILAEGIDWILGWRSPNYLYTPPNGKIKVLLRNYRLSDDIGYRFSSRWWKEWPLTGDKYASWLSACDGNTLNLFLDYETFGEHQWEETGIFEFLRHFPKHAIENGMDFLTVGETAKQYEPVGTVDVPYVLSWADLERNESAWLGNRMQQHCFKELEDLESAVTAAGEKELVDAWRMLQISDNFYYMCTKSWADGDVHKHFSPYKDWTPFESFINFMNIIQDFKQELAKRTESNMERIEARV